jgi:cbb3-type cytochrome oxidase subunit 3
MNLSDQGLLRHLVVVVLIKLVLITTLWWVFIRDARVSVDSAAMAAQVSTSALRLHQPTPGDTHGQ